MKTFLILGSLNAFLGVALGAFGAHGLKSKVAPEMLATWNTAVQYHLVHALGLLVIGMLCHLMPGAMLVRIAGWLIFLGVLLFSGSLYVMVLTGIRGLGMITPIGGVAFLIGWLLLALAGFRQGAG
ncbi:DUF423 domain-containing protein [Geoalkalibacter halelectricus]|uniref:DUF423 domain-containing protein n=1 Tax=Geoalkalibacter halelectricus TaxID=2847045 RepID=A0ABY5ZNV8_9BACT|nr:DUF423 domain-containing protein [Geoalkalibacter halelectricus]MDO3376532.1 DUF423 domain-containing protein [Geoalkalibacter halelectricus]UWZ79642.1 DUF423 domain-containing protein [Geoalkalibacter halelectricus]